MGFVDDLSLGAIAARLGGNTSAGINGFRQGALCQLCSSTLNL